MDTAYNKTGNTKFLIASSLGVFLEFLDFTLYGYIATIIAHVFLPPSSHSLDYAFLIFALGSLFRLFGTIVFGYIGDVISVKTVLTISIILMAASTIGIGLLPGYATLGIWSPILLLILRCIQGFAVSPEYNAISVYLSRQGYIQRYSFFSSFSVGISAFGMLTGGYIMAHMVGNYSIENLPEIKWRLPFIISGALLGVTTFLLRVSMNSGEAQHKVKNVTPIINIFKTQLKELLLTTFVVGFVAMLTYSLTSFIPAYLQKIRGFSIKDALNLTSGHVYLMVLIIFISGFIGDYIKRTTIMKYTILVTGLVSPIIFHYIMHGEYEQIRPAILGFSCLLGFISGVIPAFLATAFQDNQRYSGSAFAYNFGMACVGGVTPGVMFKLATINTILPGAAIFIGALLLFIGMGCLKEVGHQIN